MQRKDGPAIDLEGARRLLAQAREARSFAYVPYSHFPVGAAVLSADGRVFTGVNVENASYGLTTCAERTAVVKAVSEGVRDITAIAVTGPENNTPCPPCGSCRQILFEASPNLIVITPDEDGEPMGTPLTDLLPGAFGPAQLSDSRRQ